VTEKCGLPVPETMFWVKRELLVNSHFVVILVESNKPVMNAHLYFPFGLFTTGQTAQLSWN
jgi:hypothetical protein